MSAYDTYTDDQLVQLWEGQVRDRAATEQMRELKREQIGIELICRAFVLRSDAAMRFVHTQVTPTAMRWMRKNSKYRTLAYLQGGGAMSVDGAFDQGGAVLDVVVQESYVVLLRRWREKTSSGPRSGRRSARASPHFYSR